MRCGLQRDHEQEIVGTGGLGLDGKPLVTASGFRGMIVEYDLEQRRHHG